MKTSTRNANGQTFHQVDISDETGGLTLVLEPVGDVLNVSMTLKVEDHEACYKGRRKGRVGDMARLIEATVDALWNMGGEEVVRMFQASPRWQVWNTPSPEQYSDTWGRDHGGMARFMPPAAR